MFVHFILSIVMVNITINIRYYYFNGVDFWKVVTWFLYLEVYFKELCRLNIFIFSFFKVISQIWENMGKTPFLLSLLTKFLKKIHTFAPALFWNKFQICPELGLYLFQKMSQVQKHLLLITLFIYLVYKTNQGPIAYNKIMICVEN